MIVLGQISVLKSSNTNLGLENVCDVVMFVTVNDYST